MTQCNAAQRQGADSAGVAAGCVVLMFRARVAAGCVMPTFLVCTPCALVDGCREYTRILAPDRNSSSSATPKTQTPRAHLQGHCLHTQSSTFTSLGIDCDPRASPADTVPSCTISLQQLSLVGPPASIADQNQCLGHTVHQHMEAVCRKRGLGQLSEEPANTPHQTASVSTSGSVSTSLGSPALNQLGSPGVQPAKQQKHHHVHLREQQQAPGQSFPVLEYHMQQQGEAAPAPTLDASKAAGGGRGTAEHSSNSAISSTFTQQPADRPPTHWPCLHLHGYG